MELIAYLINNKMSNLTGFLKIGTNLLNEAIYLDVQF